MNIRYSGPSSALKPYIIWAGGKRWILSELKRYIPNDFTGRYYEPFVGGGAMFLDLKFKKTTISDINDELMNTYSTLKENCEDLISLLKIHEENSNKEYYYKIREMDRDPDFKSKYSNIERSARFIYLNKTSFNGLHRINRKGYNNTPFGYRKNHIICDENTLRTVSMYLNESNLRILQGDYKDSLADAEEGDFVYFDPPYHGTFTDYNRNGFDEDEQKRLHRTFTELTDLGVRCMLSNSSTEFIHELYSEFHIERIIAPRLISGKKKGRGPAEEVIVCNWNPDIVKQVKLSDFITNKTEETT